MDIELVGRGSIPRGVTALRVVVILNGQGQFAGFATPPPVGNRCTVQLERPSTQSAIEFTAATTPGGRVLVDVMMHEGELIGLVRPKLAKAVAKVHGPDASLPVFAVGEAPVTPRPNRPKQR